MAAGRRKHEIGSGPRDSVGGRLGFLSRPRRLPGAVVGPDGRCQADPAAAPSAVTSVHLGITECDLVRLQGQPKDIVIADLPDGRRRVEMFYAGTGGTTRGYAFIANRLVSTPPGTLKE